MRTIKVDIILPQQSNGNGGEVKATQFLTGNPGVNPLVKPSEFAQLNNVSNATQFNPASVQEK